MILNFYSIKDELSGFMTPVLDQNDAIALRNFSMAINTMGSSNSLMAFRPSDFSLYCIAQFDSLTGRVIPADSIRLVASGSSVKGDEINAEI